MGSSVTGILHPVQRVSTILKMPKGVFVCFRVDHKHTAMSQSGLVLHREAQQCFL